MFTVSEGRLWKHGQNCFDRKMVLFLSKRGWVLFLFMTSKKNGRVTNCMDRTLQILQPQDFVLWLHRLWNLTFSFDSSSFFIYLWLLSSLSSSNRFHSGTLTSVPWFTDLWNISILFESSFRKKTPQFLVRWRKGKVFDKSSTCQNIQNRPNKHRKDTFSNFPWKFQK